MSMFFVMLLITTCTDQKKSTQAVKDITDSVKSDFDFKSDIDFLKQYTEIITLQSADGNSKVAVSPALQGRVMTSTSKGDNGASYGWINRKAFIEGDTSEHMNAFGGEDRFWLGPEGGQYSIYFEKGEDFNLENWNVPRLIDLEPFDVASAADTEAVFTKNGTLENYSGTTFNFSIARKVKLLNENESLELLGIETMDGVSLVAFQTINTLINTGKVEWKKESGLLSIWILGMFNPSDSARIILPHQADAARLGSFVNDVYFGEVPDDRLSIKNNAVFFSADGKYRSKIGLKSKDAKEWLGSYDVQNQILTLVHYTKPANAREYVNSLWEIQKEPYDGDAVNAYNDGPPAPGAKPLGPFYELETSSPAAALKPGASITHTHTTFHISGDKVGDVMMKVLGVSSDEVITAFQ